MGFADESIESFLTEVAFKPGTPAGGSVAALCGACAASLTEMVITLTIKKLEDQDTIVEMEKLLKKCSAYREGLLNDMNRDSRAYNNVIDALRFSGDGEKEKEQKQIKVQESYKEAVNIPLEIAHKISRMLDIIKVAIEKGNKNIKTDAIEAHLIAKAAVLSLLNHIKTNISSITDRTFVDRVLTEVEIIKAQIK